MSYNRDEAMRLVELARKAMPRPGQWINLEKDPLRVEALIIAASGLAPQLAAAVAEIDRLEDRLGNSRALADKFAGQILDLEEARSRYVGGHDES